MTFTLQPTQVATINDEDGMLVFFDGRLVAVLVRLSDKNEVAPGDWYLEAGFGRGLDGPTHPTFPTLDAAQGWIAEHVSRGRAPSAQGFPVQRDRDPGRRSAFRTEQPSCLISCR